MHMLSPGDLSSVPERPKISHSPAPKGNESISEPQRIDRRRLEDEEDEDEDEEGMTSNLISMVRIGLDADFDDEDDEDEGLEVIRPLKSSALTMSKVANNNSAHSRTRPGKAEPRGMYLLRNTASSNDRNRSRQEDTAEKTEVMDQKLKQLSNENDYLQDTLETLRRKQGSQSKPTGTSSRIRTIPSPVNDPSSAERVRERQRLAEAKQGLGQKHKAEVEALEERARRMRQENLRREAAHSMHVDQLKKVIADLGAKLEAAEIRANEEKIRANKEEKRRREAEKRVGKLKEELAGLRAREKHGSGRVGHDEDEDGNKDGDEDGNAGGGWSVEQRMVAENVIGRLQGGGCMMPSKSPSSSPSSSSSSSTVSIAEQKQKQKQDKHHCFPKRVEAASRRIEADHESESETEGPVGALASNISPVISVRSVSGGAGKGFTIGEPRAGISFLLEQRGEDDDAYRHAQPVALLHESDLISLVPQPEEAQPAAPGIRKVSTTKELPSGAIEVTKPNGDRIITFRNGTVKELLRDGRMLVKFVNGDVREECEDGTCTYFFKETKTTEIRYASGLVLTHFPDNQMEKVHPDGTREVIFPDGSRARFTASGKVIKG